MSELKITLTMDELHELLVNAAENGASTSETAGDYTFSGIAFELVRDGKLLSRTFIEPTGLSIQRLSPADARAEKEFRDKLASGRVIGPAVDRPSLHRDPLANDGT